MMSAATNAQYRLTGRLTVPLPPDRAFELFTARGEERWAAHWKPRFPLPVTDDAVPGTVFQTDAHGHATTWIVLDSTPGRRIRYARVTPQTTAGTVTVSLNGTGGGTEVTVTYELTALTEAAAPGLREFAAGYPAFLTDWQHAITRSLRA